MERKDYEYYVGRGEVESFAKWAFGPDGLPELWVFAYGDFAFPNEDGSDNVVYCWDEAASGKDGVCYKVLEPTDKEAWDLVRTTWIPCQHVLTSHCCESSGAEKCTAEHEFVHKQSSVVGLCGHCA